jgi:hypothetical protein
MLKKSILFTKMSLLDVHKDSHSCKGNDNFFLETPNLYFDLVHIRYQNLTRDSIWSYILRNWLRCQEDGFVILSLRIFEIVAQSSNIFLNIVE